MMTKENGDPLRLDPPNGETPEPSVSAPARQVQVRTKYIYKDGPPVQFSLQVDRNLLNVLEDNRKLFCMTRNAFVKFLLRRAIDANLHLMRE